MMEMSEADSPKGQDRLVFRLVVGLLQGLALALLSEAAKLKFWPAHDPVLFVPIMLAISYGGSLLLLSANLRRTVLVPWALISLALIAGLAYYDIWRAGTEAKLRPSFELMLALYPLLFIAQSLISAADEDRRVIARYTTYFDTAWKLGLQVVLACAFVGLFWLVLFLGAQLFHIIGINEVRDFIRNRWFATPATALAFAYAIELSDVRVGLVRGMRTLALTLQSWVLPVMVLLGVAFLAALPFTGLEVLWHTRSAAAILLIAAAMLIFLINAAYRDGHDENGGRPALIKIAARIGAVALAPLAALASYALFLRINQHGLTPDRIVAAACAFTAACFAIGYVIAASNLGGWLKRLEITNVVIAVLVIAEILALYSPLADPARLSVANQVERLSEGKVTADAFDYNFLRRHAGRFGREKLAELAKTGVGKEPDKVAELAKRAAERSTRLSRTRPVQEETPKTPAEIAALITVHPVGAKLPEAFVRHDWIHDKASSLSGAALPGCLRGYTKCDALIVDLNSDGKDDVIIAVGDYQLPVFVAGEGDEFRYDGRLMPGCRGVAKALENGEFSMAPPDYQDIVAGDVRLKVQQGCPPLK